MESLPTSPTAFWQSRARETVSSWREMASTKTIGADIAAGLTVACVALPLNLALALASGLPAGVGVVTAVIAGTVAALMGGSRLQVTGPAAAMAPLAYEIVQRHGARGLVVAAFFAGVVQVFLGVARVGRLVQAIPASVVTGFMSGIGLLIIGGQIPRLLGLPVTVRSISHITHHPDVLSGVNIAAVLLGLVVLATTVLLPKLNKRIPAALIALVVVTTVSVVGALTVRTVGDIPRGIPMPSLPAFGSVDLVKLLPEALAMAALASAESLLSAVVVDSMARIPRHSSDQELIGQGLANIASSMFGGLPVTGVIVRSSVAVQSGGRTRLTPLAHSMALFVMMVAAAPLVARVPIAALAGVLLAVGIRLVDIKQLMHTWKISRFEAVVFAATMLGIVFTDFIDGVMIGLILALVQFAHRHRQLAIDFGEAVLDEPGEMAQLLDGDASEGARPRAAVVRIAGPIFFASHSHLDSLAERKHLPPYLVFDLAGVPSIDVTGCETFGNLIETLRGRGVGVLFARAPVLVREAIERSGLLPKSYDAAVHATVQDALRSVIATDRGAANVSNSARPAGADAPIGAELQPAE